MRSPRRLLPLLALPALLGACAEVGRDQCLRSAVAEVRTIDGLIAETETGLARGYGTSRQTVPYLERRRCSDGRGTCLYTETEVIETPKAIDPRSESRKLALLRARREAALPRALDHIAACKASWPQ
jgi:hypothetical protein